MDDVDVANNEHRKFKEEDMWVEKNERSLNSSWVTKVFRVARTDKWQFELKSSKMGTIEWVLQKIP